MYVICQIDQMMSRKKVMFVNKIEMICLCTKSVNNPDRCLGFTSLSIPSCAGGEKIKVFIEDDNT